MNMYAMNDPLCIALHATIKKMQVGTRCKFLETVLNDRLTSALNGVFGQGSNLKSTLEIRTEPPTALMIRDDGAMVRADLLHCEASNGGMVIAYFGKNIKDPWDDPHGPP